MKKIDYSELNKIFIENYDLIIKPYSVIYKCCIKNNIETLGELIKKHDNNELDIKNMKTKVEMNGFIDLIKYRHFGIKMDSDSILFDLIKVYNNTWKGEYKKGWKETKFISSYNYPLKRLGFSTDESNKLLYYIERIGESTSIINALIKYRNDSEKPSHNRYKGSKEVFDKKIDIIIDYYKNINTIENIELENYKKLENLLLKYKNLIERKKEIELEILETKKEIEEKKGYVNNINIKKLTKTFDIEI